MARKLSHLWHFIEPLRLRICALICVVFLIFGIIQYIWMPSFVEHMITQQLILWGPYGQIYASWVKTPLPIYNEIYFFNVTNVDDFLAQRARPHVQEIGPYVFREQREKINISWSDKDGTVGYKQKRTYYFEPGRTRGSLNDVLTHINVPMVSAVVQLGEIKKLVAPEIAHKLLYPNTNKVIEEKGNTLFQKHTIREMMFEGYDDGMIFRAPEYNVEIQFKMKFGWFAGKNGTASDGVYRIHTGAKDVKKLGRMASWNGEEMLEKWGSETCNDLSEASTGELSPPFQRPMPDKLKMFVGDICRHLTLTYKEESSFKGIHTKRYWAAPDTFSYERGSENECYCDRDRNGALECPPNGIMSLTKCHPGAATVSFPHFLYADPAARDLIDGLQPDCDKHAFIMDVEPTLGIPIRIRGRVQLNVLFKRDTRLSFAANLTEPAYYFPAIWTNSRAEIDDELAAQLILVQQKLPIILTVSSLVQIFIALLLLIIVIVYSQKYQIRQKNKRLDKLNSKSTAPPLTTTTLGQYEPVKVQEVPLGEEGDEPDESSSTQQHDMTARKS